MNLRTVNHLVASVWMLYGLHFRSWFALSVGLLWTIVYIGEIVFSMINFDERVDDILRSAERSRTVYKHRLADKTGSDYEPYDRR
jgi:hypothetical protein